MQRYKEDVNQRTHIIERTLYSKTIINKFNLKKKKQLLLNEL